MSSNCSLFVCFFVCLISVGPDGITNGGWRSGASPDYPQICVREAGKVT